jgi:hypothetical protein
MDEDAEWVTVVIDSNLGRNTGRREVMGADRNVFIRDVHKQIQDEQEAYEMYSRMAAAAASLGYEDVALQLRRVANDEAGHKSTLQHDILVQLLRAEDVRNCHVARVQATNAGRRGRRR